MMSDGMEKGRMGVTSKEEVCAIALMMKLAILKSARKWRRRDLIMLLSGWACIISRVGSDGRIVRGLRRRSKKQKAALETLKNRLSKAVIIQRPARAD